MDSYYGFSIHSWKFTVKREDDKLVTVELLGTDGRGRGERSAQVVRTLQRDVFMEVIGAEVNLMEDGEYTLKVTYECAHQPLSKASILPFKLSDIASKVLALLSVLKSKCIHHSFISPDSLFLSSEGDLKLGLFRSHDLVPMEAISHIEDDERTELESAPYATEAKSAVVVLSWLTTLQPPYHLLFPQAQRDSIFTTVIDALLRHETNFESLADQLRNRSLSAQGEKCGMCTRSAALKLECGHCTCEEDCPTDMCLQCGNVSLRVQPAQNHSSSVPGVVSSVPIPWVALARFEPRLGEFVKAYRDRFAAWREVGIDKFSMLKCVGIAWLEAVAVRENQGDTGICYLKNRLGAVSNDHSAYQHVLGALEAAQAEAAAVRKLFLRAYFQHPNFDSDLLTFLKNEARLSGYPSEISPYPDPSLLHFLGKALNSLISVYSAPFKSPHVYNQHGCVAIYLLEIDSHYFVLFP